MIEGLESITKTEFNSFFGKVSSFLKKEGYREIGQVCFNDGGYPSSNVERTGFYKGQNTVIIEFTEEWLPLVKGITTSYVGVSVYKIFVYDTLVDNLEFIGDAIPVYILEKREHS